MKIGKKKILIVACILLATTLAGATLLPSFGEIRTTASIEQAIKIDGRNYDNPIICDIDGFSGDIICDGENHYITNEGNIPVNLYWENIITPNDGGITPIIEECSFLDKIEMRVADTIEDDSFWVSIENDNGDFIYEKQFLNDNNNNEFHVYIWDLTQYEIPSDDTFNIAFYSLIDPIGAVIRVDYVKLCNEFVDIGDETSETGHNLMSWSPIIIIGTTNCRSTDGGASLTITCTPQVHDPMGFEIGPGETIVFRICYELNQGYIGEYSIISQLKYVV